MMFFVLHLDMTAYLRACFVKQLVQSPIMLLCVNGFEPGAPLTCLFIQMLHSKASEQCAITRAFEAVKTSVLDGFSHLDDPSSIHVLDKF